MDDAFLWLYKVKASLIAWPLEDNVDIVYAEIGHKVAQYRIQILLSDGGLIQCIERKRQIDHCLVTELYSFHWQNAEGKLIRRWDNVQHHPEINTFPHHMHDHNEANVLPHMPVDVFDILRIVENDRDNLQA